MNNHPLRPLLRPADRLGRHHRRRRPRPGRHGQRGHPDRPHGPGYLATPDVKAHPAPEAMPGWHGHHGVWHVENLQPGYHR